MRKLKAAEHKFKALVFRLFASSLKRRRGENAKLNGAAMCKVLFLRPEKIGDMVISLPVFDALKERFPQLEIGLVGSPRNYAVIKDDPRFSKIFLYRKNLLKDFRMLRAIRREQYDCVLDMINDDSVTTLFLSQLAAPGKPRVGIGKTKYDEFYDYNFVHADGVGGHIIENTLKLLEPFGVDTENANGYAPPYVSAEAQAKLDEYIETLGPGLRIGFNLSAGMPTRIWAAEKTEQLSRKLLASDDKTQLILITAPNDRERGEALVNKLDGSVSHVPPKLNLMEVSALLSKLDILISPDTSLIHIARSFRIPVVGLYCSAKKNFQRWRPYEQEEGAVVSNHDGHIFDIMPEQVFDRVIQVLDQRRQVTS